MLNAQLFESIGGLRAFMTAWLLIYNRERPHDSLGLGLVRRLTFLPRSTTASQSPSELSA